MVDKTLRCCLFFTANTLARTMTTMAEDEFQRTGLSPSYAFIIMLVCERPGMSQKIVAEYLQLTPSTITRFVDKLEHKGMIRRAGEGKTVLLEPTDKGKAAIADIQAAWERLYHRYSSVLGYSEGDELTAVMADAAAKLAGR